MTVFDVWKAVGGGPYEVVTCAAITARHFPGGPILRGELSSQRFRLGQTFAVAEGISATIEVGADLGQACPKAGNRAKLSRRTGILFQRSRASERGPVALVIRSASMGFLCRVTRPVQASEFASLAPAPVEAAIALPWPVPC